MNYDLNREINIFDIGNEKNTVVSQSPGQRLMYRLWGTGAGNSINQSKHISHRRYPEPLVLAKRNAGSGFEIESNAG